MKKGVHDYFKIVIYSEQVHTPAPDFFELKPVLRPGQVQAVDESRSERSQLPTLWRKDVPGDGAYYKNKPFHQESRITVPTESKDGPPDIIYQPGKLRCASASPTNGPNGQKMSAKI